MDPTGELERGMKADGYKLGPMSNDRVLAVFAPKEPGLVGS